MNKTRTMDRSVIHDIATGTIISKTNTIKEISPLSSLLIHHNHNVSYADASRQAPIKDRSSYYGRKNIPVDDVLSKNISFLLENLLKRYENSHLPTHGQGMFEFKYIRFSESIFNRIYGVYDN